MDSNENSFNSEIEQQEIIKIQTKKPPKGGFAIDVVKLASGTAFAQAIGFLLSPIVARIFSPSDFGVYSNFNSIVILVSAIACFRYEQSIMLPKSKEGAANQFGISLLISIITGIGSFFIIALLGDSIVAWLKIPQLSQYLFLIPISIILSGIFLALNYWNTRSKQFIRLTFAQINRTTSEYITKIGFGLLGFANSGGLIISTVLGSVISTCTLGFQIWRDDAKFFFENIRWKKMWEGIKRYKKFPLINTWGVLLAQLSQQTPTFLLTIYFSSTITGYYNFGYKIIRLPISLIGGAISQVFFQRASKAKSEGNLAEIVDETFFQLITVGLYPMLILTIIGRELFIVMFGINWAEAGVYSQILSVWTFFVLISTPMGTLFSVLEKQELGLYFNIALIFSRVITLVIGGMRNDVYFALVLYAVTGSIFYLYLLFKLCTLSGLSINRVGRRFFSSIIISIPFLTIVAISKWLWGQNPLLISIIGTIMGFAYYIFIVFTNPKLKEVLTASFYRVTGQRIRK